MTPDLNDALLKRGFAYHGELIGPDGQVLESRIDLNLIPTAGLDFLAGLIMGNGALQANFYVGLMASNTVPSKAMTAADLPALEASTYSETARPVWNKAYTSASGSIDNLGNRAAFTFPSSLSGSTRIYGGFLVSTSAKGGNTGTLLSIARFSSPYDVPAGSTFNLGVSLTLVSA